MKQQIDFIIKINETDIELVQGYTYLGMVLDIHLKLNACDFVLSKSADRASLSVIVKHDVNINIHFSIYTHLLIMLVLFSSCLMEVCVSNTFSNTL